MKKEKDNELLIAWMFAVCFVAGMIFAQAVFA
jgi:hypothetical protein